MVDAESHRKPITNLGNSSYGPGVHAIQTLVEATNCLKSFNWPNSSSRSTLGVRDDGISFDSLQAYTFKVTPKQAREFASHIMKMCDKIESESGHD